MSWRNTQKLLSRCNIVSFFARLWTHCTHWTHYTHCTHCTHWTHWTHWTHTVRTGHILWLYRNYMLPLSTLPCKKRRNPFAHFWARESGAERCRVACRDMLGVRCCEEKALVHGKDLSTCISTGLGYNLFQFIIHVDSWLKAGILKPIEAFYFIFHFFFILKNINDIENDWLFLSQRTNGQKK